MHTEISHAQITLAVIALTEILHGEIAHAEIALAELVHPEIGHRWEPTVDISLVKLEKAHRDYPTRIL